jgi:hypothetical protein
MRSCVKENEVVRLVDWSIDQMFYHALSCECFKVFFLKRVVPTAMEEREGRPGRGCDCGCL